jgi:hypothetical protein
MFRFVVVSCATCLLLASVASGQPDLASLWPTPDGMRWEYGFHFVETFPQPIDYTSAAYLGLQGTVGTPGGTAQVLVGEHADIPGLAVSEPDLPYLQLIVWRGRPDLREAIVARYGRGETRSIWSPNFLHPGYFMKTAEDIEMWQPDFDHRTWIYLEDDLTVGATFTLQLLPEFTDDLFLHGTVGAVDATITTPFGTFTNAVRMDYLIDFGWQTVMNEEGDLLGTVHGEHTGRVYYVPDFGPVDLYEESIPYAELDCPDCPAYMHEYEGLVTEYQSLTLTAKPVGSRSVSWGDLKSTYR